MYMNMNNTLKYIYGWNTMFIFYITDFLKYRRLSHGNKYIKPSQRSLKKTLI